MLNRIYLALVGSFMLISFQSFGQSNNECSEQIPSKGWMKNNFSEYDHTERMFDTNWELIFKRKKNHSRILSANGGLFVSRRTNSFVKNDQTYFEGEIHQVIFEKDGFDDLFYIKGLDFEFHFQVIKITECFLVINVLDMKRGVLRSSSRLIFRKS